MQLGGQGCVRSVLDRAQVSCVFGEIEAAVEGVGERIEVDAQIPDEADVS